MTETPLERDFKRWRDFLKELDQRMECFQKQERGRDEKNIVLNVITGVFGVRI